MPSILHKWIDRIETALVRTMYRRPALFLCADRDTGDCIRCAASLRRSRHLDRWVLKAVPIG